jgi:hypothetical protein
MLLGFAALRRLDSRLRLLFLVHFFILPHNLHHLLLHTIRHPSHVETVAQAVTGISQDTQEVAFSVV